MNAKLQPLSELPDFRQADALEGFFSIMTHWKADNATARRILGAPPERTFYEWKKGKSRPPARGYVAKDWLRGWHLEGIADRLFRPCTSRRLGQ